MDTPIWLIFLSLFLWGARCDRLTCPKCGKKAMLKRAGAIKNRFMRMPSHSNKIEYLENPKKLDLSQVQTNRIRTPESRTVFGLPQHIVTSMPASDEHLLSTNDGLKELNKKAIKTARALKQNPLYAYKIEPGSTLTL